MVKNLVRMFAIFAVSANASTAQSITVAPAAQQVDQSVQRKPQGFLVSPYSFAQSLRYAANALTNGYFSPTNPDHRSMKLLPLNGTIDLTRKKSAAFSPVKIIFLGDIMVSKSGNPPVLDNSMIELLQSADIIIANIESPVVVGNARTKRGWSLSFKMNALYLKSLYAHNPKATWIMSIANNHAFDTSGKNISDISGLVTTIHAIKKYMPRAHIVGAQADQASSVLSVQIKNGPKIGVIAWTDVMNWDSTHANKPVVRGTDMHLPAIAKLKKEGSFDVLIGFPHGGQEQSYQPYAPTRNHWKSLANPAGFDVIVGTGPHVVQPAEKVHGRLLFNSIGNFCSPKGPSQTKIGCIPAITVQPAHQKSGIQLAYDIHFLQQQSENVSLFSLIDKGALYPDIVARLRKNWSTLFLELSIHG